MWHILRAMDLAERDRIERPIRAFELHYRGQIACTASEITSFPHTYVRAIRFALLTFAYIHEISNQIKSS